VGSKNRPLFPKEIEVYMQVLQEAPQKPQTDPKLLANRFKTKVLPQGSDNARKIGQTIDGRNIYAQDDPREAQGYNRLKREND
jgi:hypothetical protein